MSEGFRLVRLRVVGPGVPIAEVDFGRGLNVIAGPSDTGKTFILQCINYAMGAKDPPKSIPEAGRYDRIMLSLETYDDSEVFTIERSLRGSNAVLVYEGTPEPDDPDLSPRKFKAKHSTKPDSMSQFLLGLCSLTGKRLRTNKRGKTKDLSFRDLVRLTLVDEETVISERSPIHSGRPTGKTAESSLFRLLLTGVDDSSLVAAEDPKLAEVRRSGRAEIIEDIAVQVRKDLEDLLGDDDPRREEVEKQLAAADAAAQELASHLQTEREAVDQVEDRRRAAWKEVRRIQSRLAVLQELGVRFELLDEHYRSDVSRLASISEAANRLGDLQEERCPLCGALAEHHQLEEEHRHLSPLEVHRACDAENTKLTALQADLSSTVTTTQGEIASLNVELEARAEDLRTLDDQLKQELTPKMRERLAGLAKANAARDPLLRALALFERLDHLEKLSDAATKPEDKEEELPSAAVGADEAEKFCKRVGELLKAWSFPGSGRVTFGEKDEDIIISGRRRASHGKGVRAVTHAAFILGLLRLAERESLPHPGFAVIDSPLVVYRAPDKDESLPAEVKEEFYRGTAKMFRRRQVIIIENEDPPNDLDKANVIRFTKSKAGRSGFIPTS